MSIKENLTGEQFVPGTPNYTVTKKIVHELLTKQNLVHLVTPSSPSSPNIDEEEIK